MGKVQKKANDRHKLSLSPALTDFIAKTTSLPLPQLSHHLSTFPRRWPFPRGDLYNWIETLDRFDEVLHNFNKAYGLDTGPQARPIGTAVLVAASPESTVVQLKELGLDHEGDRTLVESILIFSRLLLEKCGNRTLYNSTERLNDLLNTTSLSLLHETLRLTDVLAQRFADRGPQSPGHAQFYHFDIEKLQKLAGPIHVPISRKGPPSPLKTNKFRDKTSQPKLRRVPTTADPNDFRALIRASTIERGASSSSSEQAAATDTRIPDLDWMPLAVVRVVWSPKDSPSTTIGPLPPGVTSQELPSSPTPLRQQQSASRTGPLSSFEQGTIQPTTIDPSGIRQLELVASDLHATNIDQIIEKESQNMPQSSRYELLHKLRIAYGLLGSNESRMMLLQIRLTALGVVGQIYNEEEFTAKYFEGDPNASARQQLVHHLVELLRDPKSGHNTTSLYVQGLAMESLAILSRYRQMMPDILSALTPTSSHGLLMSLVSKGLVDIETDGDATDNETGDNWRHAVFMMWMVLMNPNVAHSSRSIEQFMHKNLISAFASGLKILTQKSLRVHICIIKFLEHLFHHFKDGLQVLNANAAFGLVCDLTDRVSKEALRLCEAGNGIPEQWKTVSMDYKTPYMQQYVLRELVSLVKDVSKHQGNHADRALRGFVDSGSLLDAFRLILSHMLEFGAHTWSEVVTAVCSFLNNEPTSYTVVSEAGIISTLLATIHPLPIDIPAERPTRTLSAVPSPRSIRLPPFADAIVNLATSFGAICLTEVGHKHFVESGVLEKFFEIFESPEHVKAIKGVNTLAQLGSTFDELVRHHPALKELVVSCVITMIARVRHICTTKFKAIGAGPKLWLDSPSGLVVDGGVAALMSEDIFGDDTADFDFEPMKLPNKDVLESGPRFRDIAQSVSYSATNEDSDGLTVLDYARPVIGFLAAFFDTHFLCKETLAAGATDLILDFVTLPTLPITDDAFSDGLLMQDLTTVVRHMAEEKPHLVLPLLLDRARYICTVALTDFVHFQPDHMQCYFGQYLDIKESDTAMDIDSDSSNNKKDIFNGTRLVKGLMSVYCITRVLSDVFTVTIYPRTSNHYSVIAAINISDILSELLLQLGKLSAACCREEISLLTSMSRTWLDATRPGNYSTGDADIDTILDVSDQHDTVQGQDDGSEKPRVSPDTADLEDVAAFRNLRTLRYLLTETPASISTLFSRIGSSFGGRKKPDTFLKQKLHMVADALAHALTIQLKPAFLSIDIQAPDPDRVKDWRFKYFTVILSQLRDSLWEESSSMPTSSIAQSYTVDCFRRAGGLKHLGEIGTEFFEELKLCQVDKPLVFAANAGLKICLELFDDLTRNELVQSQQTSYMKSTERERPFYFNPNQLLLELRMESLPLTRRIWDSEYAEQASGDVVRRLTSILKHTLKGENEEHVFAGIDDFPRLKQHDKRQYVIDAARSAILKDKHYSTTQVEEAMYRCNVSAISTMNNVDEYCRALRDNPRRRPLSAPAGDIKHNGASTEMQTPQAIHPSNAMSSTTILEDSSQDEDIMEPLETSRTHSAADTQPAADSLPGPPSNIAAMQISNLLNDTTSSTPLISRYSKQSIDAERDSIREQLAERCNNILGTHPSLVFDLNDLLAAGTAKIDEDTAKSWWESATDLLISSLLSQGSEEDLDKAQGQKVTAAAHFIGLLCNNEVIKPSMLKVLQASFDEIVGFLQLRGEKSDDDESYPWIAPILLIVEKMLAMDAEPDSIQWTPPADLDSYVEPLLKHETVVTQASKALVFNRLMDILPKVGKSQAMALAIVRVLVILTRDRALAQSQAERKNLQKLFLMVKQLSGSASGRFQSALMTVLRHVIEDEATIKQIMATEITAWFKNRTSSRQPDLATYLRELNFLALRAPTLFVEVSNEILKFTSWTPGQQGVSSPLSLRSASIRQPRLPAGATENTTIVDGTNESVEQAISTKVEDDKTQEVKVPIVEHPDGVVHFLLSELLAYKEVEDRETNQQTQIDSNSTGVLSNTTSDDLRLDTDLLDLARQPIEKPNKPRFVAGEHPIFVYRCFILHCLTELLYSYNQTKIEFISFSRKADPLAATPSKARSGVLSYLLNSLVSSGYVDRDESITCRKRMTTSDWAVRVIVALCTKTGEKDLGQAASSRYNTHPRNVEDNDTEPDLSYVRRFVLEHAVKIFKDTVTASESIQTRYARLLCLAELFSKLISKPSGPEGSAQANNTSYKRIARMMLEKNFIAVLTTAISDIDLSFPQAKKVVKFILRPLKDLTSTATELSIHSPEEFPHIIDQTVADSISSASSDMSDIDDDREETPDLYRNSALGMLDPARQDESDSEEDNDDEDDDAEQMDYDEYDDEIDYGDDMAVPINDGEVVSDEELEDMDDVGAINGLPGDVPMDIEFVVNPHHHHHNNHHHHHHHHHDEDDDESESSSDDDDTEDDDDDPEDIEIEVDEDDEIEHDVSDVQDDEDGWEDEDDDGVEGHMLGGDDFDDDLPIVGNHPPVTAHLTNLLRELDEADGNMPDLSRDPNIILQTNNAEDLEEDDEDDDDDEGDEDDDNDGLDMEFDQPFDMMLADRDLDENEDWGFEEPPPPVFRRPRHARAAMPPFFNRRILGSNEHEMHSHLLGGTRHHRHAASTRPTADEGANPLLQRPDSLPIGADEFAGLNAPIGFTVTGGSGRGMPFAFPPGGPPAVITMDGSLSLGGHGAILDAIMGAIQRGDQDFLQNGRIQFNVSPPVVRDGSRPVGVPASLLGRPVREDPVRSATFIPLLTITRWQGEAELVFGVKSLPTKTHAIQTRVYAALIPLAQMEEKERQRKQEEERKAEIERLEQAKIEADRLQKEEDERLAREKVEAEERAKVEAEVRAAAQAEQDAEQDQSGGAMEGIRSESMTAPAVAVEEPVRTYTMIRGRRLDITGLDIDPDYLEALPDDMREDVITQQYATRREQAHELGHEDSAIDQEFLDALPEEIRDEIRAQEAIAQRRRDRERARREAQNAGTLNPPQEMEPDDFLATLDPALRRAILAEQPPEILNALNPQHAAEGRAHARSMFFHRMPTQGSDELVTGRRVAAQRDTKRHQTIQLVDKAGVATLLRLMFMQQPIPVRNHLLQILSQVCANRQTRYEVVSLLLVILKEGSIDVNAIERSLASLSLRAKATVSQKTPQPLKRTLSMPPSAALSEDVTPIMVVQQCLYALSSICKNNPHVKNLFLREVDVTSTAKLKNKSKGKNKEMKTTTHPVNDLIGLLDRRLIMDNAVCLQYLALLLATVTSPIGSLMKQERDRQRIQKDAHDEAAKALSNADKNDNPGPEADVPMEDASMGLEDGQKPSTDDNKNATTHTEVQPVEVERRNPFEPPMIADENLKLITNIFVAPECGQVTFMATTNTLRSLSHIPGISEKFGQELKLHIRSLSQAICLELDDLLPVIADAQSSADVSGVVAARFSASTSDQVKMLRVLQALDYLSAPKREDDSLVETNSKSILTVSYESLTLSPLWSKLSSCLFAVEEKGDTISFANILLPLIESLMVVCKHTTLKDTPIQVKEVAVTSPIAVVYQDEIEELFFRFTSDHRKILNDIVRQTPKLMQGNFSILVKNSKVLDFDNKRNFFSKQIHSRHHQPTRPPTAQLQLNVRRDQVFIDSYKALYYKTADEMKYGKLNIRFNGEEGVDAGGVTREWFQVLARGMFDANYALFQPMASDKTTFHPSTLSRVNPEHLLYFKFIGRIIGKALHEGRVLDCHFSRAVYKRILGKKPNLKDLESNDVDYYKSLCWILESDITDILTEEFCVIENEFGEEKIIDLIPDGQNIAVTEENKKEYVQKLVEYRLTESVKDQLDSFLGGFHDIIPAELISIFNEQELELLISGLPEIDVDDWKANTEYHNYNPSSQQIVWYWRIVKAMTNEERAKLLQFITGTSKVPLNGFKELEGVSGLTRCNIHKDPSTNRLPTSHTCFNQLDLPAYESFDIMKQNITTAIHLGADYFGFA